MCWMLEITRPERHTLLFIGATTDYNYGIARGARAGRAG
jgi:hypothetical protein